MTLQLFKNCAYLLTCLAISPYLYPEYGLGGLPEGFSRLAAVNGGTFMLGRDISEIVRGKDGKVIGVISKNPDEKDQEEAATASIVVGDPTYFESSRCEMVEHVVRSICILKNPIPRLGQDVDSCQIIIPQGQCNRQHDIYITMVGRKLRCVPEGKFVPSSKSQGLSFPWLGIWKSNSLNLPHFIMDCPTEINQMGSQNFILDYRAALTFAATSAGTHCIQRSSCASMKCKAASGPSACSSSMNTSMLPITPPGQMRFPK